MDILTGKNIPEPLLNIPDPPKQLYVRGNLPDTKTHIYICVVGARKHSVYGKRACEQIISEMRGFPIVIVSGLAFGIDTIAHQSALDAGLKTIAFPGSGLDDEIIYPALNFSLAQEILQNGGCLVSEFDPDVRAARWTFPRRNRLMAGISRATLIIEAKKKSGTLITAECALDYNRDVFAIPGSIFSETSDGTNNLIKQGAVPITSSEQLLEELGFNLSDYKKQNNKNETRYKDLTEQEKRILTLLQTPKSRNDLIRDIGLSTSDAVVLLSSMELRGLIVDHLGEITKC